MTALVTGGAGFIGSHLVEALLGRGEEVRVLDDLSTGTMASVAPAAQMVRGSVADADTVRAAMEGVDVVFHLAAHRAVLQSVERPLRTDAVNTHGTLGVLVAAVDAGVRRVVFSSSSSVYGGAANGPTSEIAPTVPRSPYAVSKLAGEHYCRVFSELHGIETVSLRYFNVYGPRQRPDSRYAAVVPLFVRAMLAGVPPTVHGDGHQSRDFTYVGDVVAANIAAASASSAHCRGDAYNVAAGSPRSLLYLLDVLTAIIGASPTPVHVGRRPGDVRHSHADLTSAGRCLGYRPTVMLDEGLRATVSWAVSDGQPASSGAASAVQGTALAVSSAGTGENRPRALANSSGVDAKTDPEGRSRLERRRG